MQNLLITFLLKLKIIIEENKSPKIRAGKKAPIRAYALKRTRARFTHRSVAACMRYMKNSPFFKLLYMADMSGKKQTQYRLKILTSLYFKTGSDCELRTV